MRAEQRLMVHVKQPWGNMFCCM